MTSIEDDYRTLVSLKEVTLFVAYLPISRYEDVRGTVSFIGGLIIVTVVFPK
jgi:hypothetical protein